VEWQGSIAIEHCAAPFAKSGPSPPCKDGQVTISRIPVNSARPDQPDHRELFGILPPLAVVVTVLLALLLFLSGQRDQSLSQALALYSSAAIPHFAALMVLFKGAAPRRAFIAGFLCGFWGSCVVYLLFIGIFLFSQEYSHGNQKIGWFAGVGIGTWMVLGSLFSAKLDKSSYVKGCVTGVLYPYAAMVCLALTQRAHS
jgi:hypothetical protein